MRDGIRSMDITTLDKSDRKAREWQLCANARRAERAHQAATAVDPCNDLPTNIVDLLANLMHLAEAEGLDFIELLEGGRQHFEAERSADPTEWMG